MWDQDIPQFSCTRKITQNRENVNCYSLIYYAIDLLLNVYYSKFAFVCLMIGEATPMRHYMIFHGAGNDGTYESTDSDGT